MEKLTKLQAYKNFEKMVKDKGYTQGKKIPIRNPLMQNYVRSIKEGKIGLQDVPGRFLLDDFFIHALAEDLYNTSNVHEEIVDYVKSHPDRFNKQFFKNHIATDFYALKGPLNDFEFMPIEYIDEEMVSCAMLAIFEADDFNDIYETNPSDVRKGFDYLDGWFYSVAKRKPNVLTQDFYTLGARYFARSCHGENKFLSITPEKNRTTEYYWAMCIENNTPVLDGVPIEALSDNFLFALTNKNPKNIKAFSNEFLERPTHLLGRGTVKFWQAFIILNGMKAKYLPLNEERVSFVIDLYGEDSKEYQELTNL